MARGGLYSLTMKLHLPIALLILAIICPGHIVRADAFMWPEATPEVVNIDPQMITALVAAIEWGDYGRLKSLLILIVATCLEFEYTS